MADDISERHIDALLEDMTLAEKIGQLTMARGGGGTGGPELMDAQLDDVRAGRIGSILDMWGVDGVRRAQAVAVNESRLGIPLLVTLDVLHGYETIFPIPLAEAAAFDPELWERTAQAAAEEAAASDVALTFAPMLDVARDPRWGRIAESPGEDPWLGARFAEAKVRGFQRGLADASTLAATAKHLGAYGAVMAGREYNSVDISARSLHEVHLPPFAAAVRAGVAAIMPSFNDLAGVPMTANAFVLRDLVRERWGFGGVMISDFGAMAELLVHGVAADLAEAAALCLKAGVDIDMVSDTYPKGLPVALERGLVSQTLVDEAVRRVLTLKARLGLLKGKSRGSPQVSSERRLEHRALALDAARRSLVLLRNEGDVLPLSGEARRLAVIGPLAAARQEMLGPWYAAGKAEETSDVFSALQHALPEWTLVHEPGSAISGAEPDGLDAAMEAARQADMVLLCLGEGSGMSGEAASRARPGLPDCQRKLAEAVFALKKPTVAVLCAGRPLTVPWLFEKANAVLAAWFPGNAAGAAIVEVLTGAWNPSGKLPVSWPVDVGQIPVFFGRRPTGRPADPKDACTSKYIDMQVAPLFPFGHGLSYTRFAYRGMRLSSENLNAGDSLTVEVDVANEGKRDGEETAFLFFRDPLASVARPLLELRGAARIALAAGQQGTLRFHVKSEDFGFPDEQGNPCLEAGEIEILAGPSAERGALLSARIHIEA